MGTPAVFVEFEDIAWQQGAMGSRRGDVGIRLHIIDRYIPTDGSKDSLDPLGYFKVIDEINEALWLLSGDRFAGMMLKTSSTDHEHRELIEDIEEWVCTATYPQVRTAQASNIANIDITHKEEN